MYDVSPIPKSRLGGVWTFALVGALDAALMLLYLILLLTNGDVTGATNHKGLTVLGILIVVLAATWVLAWFAARQRGIDLDVVQNQLPPE